MNLLDKKIPMTMMASAMFGPKGADDLRNGLGWWDRRTLGLGWLLYAFTRVVEPELVVEAGAGGSSFCILQALKDNGHGHLYTIDCWPVSKPKDSGATRFFPDGTPYTMEHEWFLDMLKEHRMEDICTLHYGRSEDVAKTWDQPIEMLMVDSSHLPEPTKAEIAGFLPHLVPGGYAFFHDPLVCFDAIGRQLVKFAEEHDDYSLFLEPDFLSMGILQRKYTLNFAHMWVAGCFTQPSNPQFQSTPFQGTNIRAMGALGEWEGKWFPTQEECGKTHDLMKKLSEEIIASGEEQSLEYVQKRIHETLMGKGD